MFRRRFRREIMATFSTWWSSRYRAVLHNSMSSHELSCFLCFFLSIWLHRFVLLSESPWPISLSSIVCINYSLSFDFLKATLLVRFHDLVSSWGLQLSTELTLDVFWEVFSPSLGSLWRMTNYHQLTSKVLHQLFRLRLGSDLQS